MNKIIISSLLFFLICTCQSKMVKKKQVKKSQDCALLQQKKILKAQKKAERKRLKKERKASWQIKNKRRKDNYKFKKNLKKQSKKYQASQKYNTIKNYKDAMLAQKNIENKAEQLSIGVDSVTKTVTNLEYPAHIIELLALLKIIINYKVAYAELKNQTIMFGLFYQQDYAQLQKILDMFHFRFGKPLIDSQKKLFFLFGALVDKQAVKSLSEQDESQRDIIKATLTAIGKEGLKDHIFNLLVLKLEPIKKEIKKIESAGLISSNHVDFSYKDHFEDQVAKLIQEKKQLIEFIITACKDMLFADQIEILKRIL